MINKKVEQLIEYLLNAFNSGKSAHELQIDYSSLNKTFSIQIDDIQHLLSKNQLSDASNIGDSLADEISLWAK